MINFALIDILHVISQIDTWRCINLIITKGRVYYSNYRWVCRTHWHGETL